MPSITNIAAYQFAELTDLKPLRERLLALCRGWELRGTILLSPEGINLFVAGGAGEVELLLAELRAIKGLEGLAAKYSESEDQPFKRMLVRLKKEIIAFGVEGIRPGVRTSPKLSARTLKQWLDEGRAVTLLDTRNDYEVKLGTFKGARTLGLDHFRHFPEAVSQLPEEMKDEPIVMFCTGGIRCEKAGPYMEREGFRNIYQLEGGILKYFEECGAEHYEGECFVFDQRVGVDPALHETSSAQCFVCQTPLTAEEQNDPRYVPNVSCPHCYRTEEEAMEERLKARQEAFTRLVETLPGAAAYFDEKPFLVPPEMEGKPLIECLCSLFPETSEAEWGDRIAAGQISREEGGARYVLRSPHPAEPHVCTDIEFLYEDAALILIRKPAGIPVKPDGGFQRNTLQYLFQSLYAPENPRPINLVPANEAGLLLWARTRHFEKMLLKKPFKATASGLSFTHPVTGALIKFSA